VRWQHESEKASEKLSVKYPAKGLGVSTLNTMVTDFENDVVTCL
jgi:hypothetical protein